MAARKKATKVTGSAEIKAAVPKPKAVTTISGIVPEPVEVKVGTEAVLVFKARKKMTVAAFNAAAKMLRAEQDAAGVKIVLQPNSVELEK